MSFKIIDNRGSGDLEVEITGESVNNVFKDAATALFSSMIDTSTVDEHQVILVKLKKTNLEKLLFNFLSELIYIKDAQHFFAKTVDVKVNKIKMTFYLDAKIYGEKIGQERHVFKYDVKAVTLHNFSLVQTKECWVARVMFDL